MFPRESKVSVIPVPKSFISPEVQVHKKVEMEFYTTHSFQCPSPWKWAAAQRRECSLQDPLFPRFSKQLTENPLVLGQGQESRGE